MRSVTKLAIGAMIAVALFAVGSVALAEGEWLRTGPVWFKGKIYAGSSKVQLTDATGTLSFSAATSLETSITAFATGGQASATQLGSDVSIVTVCATAADSVKLPAAASGRIMSVTNSGAAALAVFPGTGDTIDGGSANASVTIAVNGTQVFRGISASAWKTVGPVMVNGQPSALSLFDPATYSLTAAVTAAGTSKTDATALTKEINVVTTATALQGVTLLTAAAGLHQRVVNETAVTVIVYPLDAGNDTLQVGQLAALSADTGYAVGPLGSLDCNAYTTTAWRCDYALGSRSTVAGAGTTIADATAFGSVTMGSRVAVTAADATVGVTLPTGGSASTYIPGCISVQSTVNTNTAYLKVYGNNSDNDTINGAAADAVFTMGAGASVTFCTVDGVAWLTQ